MEESIWECLDLETQAELSQSPLQELDIASDDEMMPLGDLVHNLRCI